MLPARLRIGNGIAIDPFVPGWRSFLRHWRKLGLFLPAAGRNGGIRRPIFAFEPNPRTFVDLEDVVRQAGVADRVQPCPFGLGRASGTMALAEADNFSTGFARLVSAGAGRKITVKRLDELEFPEPQVIKIDAEGMEADILAGGSNVLSAARPFVLFENFLDYVSPERTFASLELLRGHGYRLFVPALLFPRNGRWVMMTYGADPHELISTGAEPQMGLFEVNPKNRFLLGLQLNILAVPPAKVAGLWTAGFINLNEPPAKT